MRSKRFLHAVLIAVFAITLNQIALADSASGSFSKTLTVSGDPNVLITTGSGNITVRSGNATSVQIEARIKANDNWGWGGNSRLSAQERVKRIEDNPPIAQNGNTITIGKIEDREVGERVSISYEVTVPSTTKLESRTGSGSVEIESLQGPVRAESGSGHLRVSRISNEVHLNTGSGSIELDGAEGNVSAHTGSGHIKLFKVNGGLEASTGSGGIEAEGLAKSDWDLHTGSGGIRVRMPSQSGFKVDAHSGSGTVTVNHPITMQGSLRHNHIEGTVGSGGPVLRLRTGSGGIDID